MLLPPVSCCFLCIATQHVLALPVGFGTSQQQQQQQQMLMVVHRLAGSSEL
jgi:hypothetical protein